MKKRPPTAEQRLATYLNAISQLPAPPVPIILPECDSKYMQCLCGNMKLKTDMPIRSTGIVSFRDTLCPGCVKPKESRNWATLVCYKCRTVLGKIEPMKDKDGFVFERGKCYHTSRCPACCADILQTEITERVLWQRNRLR